MQSLPHPFPNPPLSSSSTPLHKQLFSPHQRTEHDNHRARRNPQNPHFTHRIHQRHEHLPPRICPHTLQQTTSRARNGCLDLLSRHVWQYSRDAVTRFIEKDGIGDGEGDRRATNLCTGDEADSEGYSLLVDLRLRHAKGSLDEGASADTCEDSIAVDFALGGIDFEKGVEQDLADEGEYAAEDKPGRVVASRGHDGAIGDAEKYQHAYEGKEVNTC